jgi:hypothetical protein
MGEAIHWVDKKLLDLWSIAVLQVVGLTCGAMCAAAVQRGQALALVLGMASVLYVIGAGAWFACVVLAVLARGAGRGFQPAGPVRRARLVRWLISDAFLVAAMPVLFGIAFL